MKPNGAPSIWGEAWLRLSIHIYVLNQKFISLTCHGQDLLERESTAGKSIRAKGSGIVVGPHLKSRTLHPHIQPEEFKRFWWVIEFVASSAELPAWHEDLWFLVTLLFVPIVNGLVLSRKLWNSCFYKRYMTCTASTPHERKVETDRWNSCESKVSSRLDLSIIMNEFLT